MSDAQQKSPEAFRTISEVATDLDLPQHVLRFWETKFAQIKPMKRGGGRRYYRPEDVDLLRGIRLLLYGEGFTIRGVQRVLKDRGAAFVATAGATGAVQTLTAEDRDEPRVTPPRASSRRKAARAEPKIEPTIEAEPEFVTEPAFEALADDRDEPADDGADEPGAIILDEPDEDEAGAPQPMPPEVLRDFLPAHVRETLPPAPESKAAGPVRETPRPRDIPMPPVARGLGVERRRRLEAALDNLIEARQLLEQAR